MIQSMTGFAVASESIDGASASIDGASAVASRGTVSLELRTVNSRFLDLQFRIAEELRGAEPLLRELIGARIARGKVDCRLGFAGPSGATAVALDAQALAQLRALSHEALKSFPDAGPLRVADVLRWPGVLAEPQLDEQRRAQIDAAVSSLARRALDELVAARAREGERLAAILRERVAQMRGHLARVAPLLPEAVAAYRARLAERLREAIAGETEERVRAEVAVFAAKSDVDEELTRLAAHLDEVERVLAKGASGGAKGDSVGKRLDFLAQELNREANTLASKAAGLKIADCALELKLLIEQIREQVQNIE
jgi:uncharacterized protein (TIGR00255 family)